MKPVQIEDYRGEFFRVLDQTERSQLATMTLQPGQNSRQGDVHPGDQVVYIVDGQARVKVDEEEYMLAPGMALIIAQGSPHRISNAGEEELVVFNVYAPPAY